MVVIFLCLVVGSCSEPSGRSDGAAARNRGVSDTDKKELQLASMTSEEGRHEDISVERLLELEISSRDMAGFVSRVRDLRWKIVRDRPGLLLPLMEEITDRTADDARRLGADLSAACRVYDDAIIWMREAIAPRVVFPKDDGDVQDWSPFSEAFQKIIKQSDAYAALWSETDGVRKIPLRDMLVESDDTVWGPVGSALVVNFSAGILSLATKPEAHDEKSSIWALNSASAGWHDFELEFECEILKGGFDILLRYSADRGDRPYSLSYRVGPFEINTTYRNSHRIIGSRVYARTYPEPESVDEFDWTISRFGGVGIRLHDHSHIIIKSLRVKVIRH